MAAAANGDIFLATMHGLFHNQRTMNTWHYRLDDVQGACTVQDCYAAISEAFRTAATGMIAQFKVCAPNEWSFKEMWYQRVHPVRVQKLIEQLNTGGGSGGPSQITNISAVITRFGEVASRSSRSRLHVPIPPAAVTAGALTFQHAGYLTALAQSCTNLIPVLFNVAVLTPVIWSPMNEDKPFVTNIDVYGAKVETSQRVVRRRTVGVGI